jgi:dTDP-4-dehydrorhamnose reductase
MKVCVFGASGYVGASVYRLLQEMPDTETVGTYLEDPAMFDDLEQLDINQPETFSDFYKQEQPDVIVWSVMSGPNEYQLTNQGLMHILTHITPQTKLIYISSDLVFSDGKGPYKEEDPISSLPDDHIYSNYTNAKVKAERLIEKELTNYAIVRAGPIYGENKIGQLDEWTDKLSAHGQINKVMECRDDLIRTFVHIDDLANAIIDIVHNDATGIYHAGPDKQQSYYQFMRQKAEALGFDRNLIEKGSEYEEADQGLPKNTGLLTGKINKATGRKFR